MFTFSSSASNLGAGAPVPTLTLGRYFYFAALGQCYSVLHPTAHTAGGARLTAQTLLLHITAWPDALSLQLDRQHLTSTWTGTYPLGGRGKRTVVVAYGYGHWLDAAPQRLKHQKALVLGNVTITAYDAHRRRLSGYFELNATNQPAPIDLAGCRTQRCLLRLAGEFNDLVVMGQ